ncbi:UNVERIFIED_CONTAM: hypothetical protein FKN15_039121 [Acipenser sinensis]
MKSIEELITRIKRNTAAQKVETGEWATRSGANRAGAAAPKVGGGGEPEGMELPSREPEGVELPSREPEGVELPS